jgi:hypothetical protein
MEYLMLPTHPATQLQVLDHNLNHPQMGLNYSRPPGNHDLFWLVPPSFQASHRHRHRHRQYRHRRRSFCYDSGEASRKKKSSPCFVALLCCACFGLVRLDTDTASTAQGNRKRTCHTTKVYVSNHLASGQGLVLPFPILAPP